VPVTRASLQLSIATGITQVVFTQESKLVKTTLVGQKAKRGLMVSFAQGLVTVTVKEQVAVLFLVSLAVKVTVVVPKPKHEFGDFVLVTVGMPQLSVAVGAVQVASEQESMLTIEILVGQRVKTGLMVSTTQSAVVWLTVTVNEQ
jgi:hypothetical protein